MKRRLSCHTETWASLIPFRIARNTSYDFPCVVCEIEQDGIVGRGEALGVGYLGEDPQSMLIQIDGLRSRIEAGMTRTELQDALPAGGARNAVDAALWDLDSMQSGRSAWQIAGLAANPIETVFTIGLEDTPELMAAKASGAGDLSLFKVKLDDDRPVERVRAIRDARPDARLVVDANEGWSFRQLREVAPALAELGVRMIEQPLPRGADGPLEKYRSPLPLCGDESCQQLDELEAASQRYGMINIKLDKCGGLTHGLQLARAAREKGLGLMVGCMGGTSLSMAPAHVLAQMCDFVDIDGPLLLKNDRPGGLVYDRGVASLPARPFWGNHTAQ